MAKKGGRKNKSKGTKSPSGGKKDGAVKGTEEMTPLRAKASRSEDEDDGHDEYDVQSPRNEHDNDEESQSNVDSSSSAEDDDDYEYDDDDDDDSTFWSDFKDAWRQHCVALLVAVIATAVAVFYNQNILSLYSSISGRGIGAMKQRKSLSSRYSSPAMQPVMAPTTDATAAAFYQRHAHLDNFRRTANISFCGNVDLALRKNELLTITADDEVVGSNINAGGSSNNDLRVMDFSLSKEWITAMELHYAADILEDDSYEETFELNAGHMKELTRKDSQLACLKQRVEQETQNKTYIKGITHYYKSPDFDTYYTEEYKREQERLSVMKTKSVLQPAHLTFTGFGAKFFNLSPKPVLLYWDGKTQEQRRLVGEIAPFESLGTATTPGQSFSVSPVYDSSHALQRWVVTADECLIYYEPMLDIYGDHKLEVSKLSQKHKYMYYMQKLNQDFAKDYLIHSGRAWLSQFPRPYPINFMWNANYIGQKYNFDTFDGHKHTMTVESVTPRVFSIPNFLSADECDQLIQLAVQQGLKGSTLYSGSMASHQRDLSTRSSTNTWLERDTTNLTDTVYRRAADLLHINPDLLQSSDIDDELHPHEHSLAESLQVVRYKKGEEYTAHHDFVYPSQRHRMQPTRFATLLLYLNDNYEGGETVFPRAVNAHNHEGVTIKPQKGMAALFYGVLPDGNVDDLSQHSSQPVTKGQKFLANLWIWEPVIN